VVNPHSRDHQPTSSDRWLVVAVEVSQRPVGSSKGSSKGTPEAGRLSIVDLALVERPVKDPIPGCYMGRTELKNCEPGPDPVQIQIRRFR
jgi:hypothetical protein